ncbi:hypothetical protein EV122DRAFT_277004 [Schizophyllum commune]
MRENPDYESSGDERADLEAIEDFQEEMRPRDEVEELCRRYRVDKARFLADKSDNFEVAAAAGITPNGKYLVTSPNSTEIPVPMTGTRTVRLRRDGRFGLDDPAYRPVFFCDAYPHLPLVPKYTADSKYSVCFEYPQRQTWFHPISAAVNDIGTLSAPLVERFQVLRNELRVYSHSLATSAETANRQTDDKDVCLMVGLVQTIHFEVCRADCAPSTWTDLNFLLLTLQRHILEAVALRSYLSSVRSRLTGSQRLEGLLPQVEDVLGAFTADAMMARRLAYAGIPVYLVHDLARVKLIAQENPDMPVPRTATFVLLQRWCDFVDDQDDMVEVEVDGVREALPVHPVIYKGPQGRSLMIRRMHELRQTLFLTADVWEEGDSDMADPLLVRPETSMHLDGRPHSIARSVTQVAAAIPHSYGEQVPSDTLAVRRQVASTWRAAGALSSMSSSSSSSSSRPRHDDRREQGLSSEQSSKREAYRAGLPLQRPTRSQEGGSSRAKGKSSLAGVERHFEPPMPMFEAPMPSTQPVWRVIVEMSKDTCTYNGSAAYPFPFPPHIVAAQNPDKRARTIQFYITSLPYLLAQFAQTVEDDEPRGLLNSEWRILLNLPFKKGLTGLASASPTHAQQEIMSILDIYTGDASNVQALINNLGNPYAFEDDMISGLPSPLVLRRILWYAHELLFRTQFMLLDRIRRQKVWEAVDLATRRGFPRPRRPVTEDFVLSRCFAPESMKADFYIPRIPLSNVGLVADHWQHRHPYMTAFAAVMENWTLAPDVPSCIRGRCDDINAWTQDTYEEWERMIIKHYIHSFIDVYSFPPEVPRCVQ